MLPKTNENQKIYAKLADLLNNDGGYAVVVMLTHIDKDFASILENLLINGIKLIPGTTSGNTQLKEQINIIEAVKILKDYETMMSSFIYLISNAGEYILNEVILIVTKEKKNK